MLALLLLLAPPALGSGNPCGDWMDRIGHGGVVWTENAVIVQREGGLGKQVRQCSFAGDLDIDSLTI